jgi:hypothetical protein
LEQLIFVIIRFSSENSIGEALQVNIIPSTTLGVPVNCFILNAFGARLTRLTNMQSPGDKVKSSAADVPILCNLIVP